MTAPNPLASELPADAFSLTPDPAGVFARRDHAAALATLKRGLEARQGLLVAVAEVGMGKTTLAYALLSSLGTEVRTAYVANPRLPFEGLLRHALVDLGVQCDAAERSVLLGRLRTFLDDCAACNHSAVLVVDEAQSLEDGTFEDLPVLLDLGLQVILVGQPELDAKLQQPRLRRVAARIAVRVDLKPLDKEESRRYVAHRLAQSGGAIETFSAPALDLILRRAQGVPRRMNILCHNALLLAYAAGAAPVTREMAREAIHELSGGTLVLLRGNAAADAAGAARRWRLAGWGSAGAAAVAAGAFLVVQWRQPAGPPSAAVVRTRPASTVVAMAPAPPTMPRAEPAPPPPSVAPPRASEAPAAPASKPPPLPPVQIARAIPPSVPKPPSRTPPEPVAAAPRAEEPPSTARPAGVTDVEVRALLDRYVRAWHAQDVAELRRIGQIADDRQEQALAKYFAGVRDLRVEIEVLEMTDGADGRTVRFTRRDRFRDPGGREVSKESPPIEKTVVRTPDGVRFAPRS